MQSTDRNEESARDPRRTGLAVLALIAALLLVAWFVFADQELVAEHPPLVAIDTTESAPAPILPVLPDPLQDETGHAHVASAEAPSPVSLVAPVSRLRVESSGDGLVPDPPILSIARADGSWHDAWRVRSFAGSDAWRTLQPGAYRLSALNGGWEVTQPSFELEEGETFAVGVSALTSIPVQVLGGRTSRPEAEYAVGVETRWVGSTGARLLGPTFQVADEEGRCRLVGLPLQSAGQALEALRAVVQLPDKDMQVLTSDWLPASKLGLGIELAVPVPEPAIVGRITSDVADDSMTVYLLPVSWVPGVVSTFSFSMLDLADTEGDIIAQTATVDGEYEFRLARLPDEAVHVCVVAGAYDLDAVADSGPIDVPPFGEPVRVDLAVRKGGAIKGTIRGSVASVIDKDEQLQSVFNIADVVAYRVMDVPTTWGPRRYRSVIVPTHGEGECFEMSGLAAGDYEVSVVIWSREPQLSEAAIPARRLMRRVSVAPGLVTNVVFDVDEPPRGNRLCGSVQLPPGLAPARNFVTAWARGAATTEPLLGSGVSAAGTFTLADLPPGPLTLGAVAVDESQHSAGVAIVELPAAACDGSLVLTMTASQTRFRTTGQLPNTVLVEPGPGLSQAELCQLLPDVLLNLDEAGTAVLFGLPPGEYVARFGEDTRVPFTVLAGTPVTVECP